LRNAVEKALVRQSLVSGGPESAGPGERPGDIHSGAPASPDGGCAALIRPTSFTVFLNRYQGFGDTPMPRPSRNPSQPQLRLAPAAGAGAPAQRSIRLQHSTLAGFRHHEAPQLWPALARRAPLTLEREPDNPHDANAVALRWRGRKLGYLPRGENLVAACLLDRRRQLSARIERLDPSAERNARIGIEVILC
jgi:hypothetical protein